MVVTRNISLEESVGEVFDEMSMNKFLKRKCTVDEYYDAFNSSFSNKGLDEWYLIDLFVFGLLPEIEKKVEMFKPNSLLDAYHLAREVMDEVDGKVFVENGLKLNKIDESQVGVPCLEDSIMDCDKDDKEDDGDILNKEIDHSKEVKENSIDLEFSDDEKEKVEGIGMNPKGLVELDGKNIEMDDKCLEVIDSFVNKDDEAEENKKRRSLSILDSLGEIHGGAKRSEMNKSNVRSLDDEYDMCALEAEKKSEDGEAIESITTKEMFAAYDAQKNNMSVEGFVGHSMKKNDHEGAWYEQITKKKTKNKAKTTKLDTEWKSCKGQGQSKAKDQISQVKVNSTNQQSKPEP
ncbi:hypothetical protein Tco_1379932 [Tanacetum coccineum]